MGFIIIALVGIVVIIVVVMRANAKKQVEAQERQAVQMSMESLARVIDNSVQIINDTKNIETLKSREQVVLDKLNELEGYERLGYTLLKKSSSATAREVKNVINARLVEMGQVLSDDILAKKDSYASVQSAITAISKVQQKLIEHQRVLNEDAENFDGAKAGLQDLHDALRAEVFVGQLKGLVEKADKEEFKGNVKKARDRYMEALHFLKTAGVDVSKYTKEQKYIEEKIGSTTN